MVTGFMISNLLPFFPASPQIRNQGFRMIVNLILADLPKKPHYTRIVTKSNDPNIRNVSAQEILGPKDTVLGPAIVPVSSEPVDQH